MRETVAAQPTWAVLCAAALALLAACTPEEIDISEVEARSDEALQAILSRAISKPGGQSYAVGEVGGEWRATINNDPKTFNTLTARDADSRAVIDPLYDFLADYDPYTREWLPNLAAFETEIDEEQDKLRVIFTLRDDLYWTLPGQARREGVQATADDVVFWYDQIEGNRDLQQPGYAQQFVNMADGSQERITIEKIDRLSFAFNYPRIVANPILSSNMDFGPRHIYQPVLEAEGIEGVQNLFSVDTGVTTIPSIGELHIVEYTPGVRVVMQRNPNYWKLDDNATALPYIERFAVRIVPDVNAEFLLFKQGDNDSYTARPEDLDELLAAENADYSVYNGGATLGAGMLVINQNPNGLEEYKYNWFIRKEFRQALSSLLNRERIVDQVYRGLAEPAHHFFARPNPFFDEDIKLKYTYNPRRAIRLLRALDIRPDDEGQMRDADGNPIEFDIIMGAENNVGIDIANIFADELAQVGIVLNVRPIDFQKLVESLTVTYDWEAVLLGGWVNYWPSSGSNVWQSSGNFHLWHPLQAEPASEWEARVDELYNEGRFSTDRRAAKRIYDEYQQLLLEQLPILYTVHALSFSAVRDRWDNVFYDTLNGLDTQYLFLKEL